MKRLLCLIVCLLFVVMMTGCQANRNAIMVGAAYYRVGDYDKGMTPYISFSEDNNFCMGGGMALSFAEPGEFEIKGNKLTAESESMIWVFEIKSKNKLVLIDKENKSGNNDIDFFKLPIKAEFVYSNDLV